MKKRYLIISPVADAAAFDIDYLALFSPGEVDPLNVGLSATGEPPATYYWASRFVDEDLYDKVIALTSSHPNISITRFNDDADPMYAQRLRIELGLIVIPDQEDE